MRAKMVLLWILVCLAPVSIAQIYVGARIPSLNIGFDVSLYPEMRLVPGVPVYYAPGINANYFYYDGMYWVYQGDNWYASSWYNGPWDLVRSLDVPDYLLRVPVAYYLLPPMYFGGWQSDAPPRWGVHWGAQWSQRRGGWDRWDRRSVPAPATLPVYQRKYSGSRYPGADQQAPLQQQNDRYRPRDPAVQKLTALRQANSPGAQPSYKEGSREAPQVQRPRDSSRPQEAPRQQAPPSQRPQESPRQQQTPPSLRPQESPRQQAPPAQAPQESPRQQQAPHSEEPRGEQGRGGGEDHSAERR